MTARDRVGLIFGAILKGTAGLFMVTAGLFFWLGGRALNEFWHVNRVVAELLGLGLAVLLGVLGLGLKAYSEH